jgi:hypothetical protein
MRPMSGVSKNRHGVYDVRKKVPNGWNNPPPRFWTTVSPDKPSSSVVSTQSVSPNKCSHEATSGIGVYGARFDLAPAKNASLDAILFA